MLNSHPMNRMHCTSGHDVQSFTCTHVKEELVESRVTVGREDLPEVRLNWQALNHCPCGVAHAHSLVEGEGGEGRGVHFGALCRRLLRGVLGKVG